MRIGDPITATMVGLWVTRPTTFINRREIKFCCNWLLGRKIAIHKYGHKHRFDVFPAKNKKII